MTPRQPQVAIGAVVIHEGKILLVKRKNPPGKNFWALPGEVSDGVRLFRKPPFAKSRKKQDY